MRKVLPVIMVGAALLAACGTSEPAPQASATVASAPWQVVDCSGAVANQPSQVSEGQLGTDDVQVADVRGVPFVSVKADPAPVSALQVVDVIEGDGAEVQPGSTVAVHYCGIDLNTAALFDSSFSRGAPATFSLAKVVPGFAQGLVGMKTGGQRLLVIPPDLAYGASPPPGMAPNATLIFVVDMVATQ